MWHESNSGTFFNNDMIPTTYAVHEIYMTCKNICIRKKYYSLALQNEWLSAWTQHHIAYPFGFLNNVFSGIQNTMHALVFKNVWFHLFFTGQWTQTVWRENELYWLAQSGYFSRTSELHMLCRKVFFFKKWYFSSNFNARSSIGSAYTKGNT